MKYNQGSLKKFVLIIIAALLPALLLAAGAFAGTSESNSREIKIRELLNQGIALYNTKHIDPNALDKGMEKFREALALNPDCSEAWWRLAEHSYMKAETLTKISARKILFKEALAYAGKAVDIDKNSVPGHFYIGCGYAGLVESSGAFSAFGQIRKAKKAFYWTIDAKSHNKYAILSRVVLSMILSVAPWPIGDMKEAEKLAAQATDMDPNLTMASVQMGMIYINKKEYEKARAELKRCLEIQNPTFIPDAVLYDWPQARRLLKRIKNAN